MGDLDAADIAIRLVAAAVFGAVIGAEREAEGRDAGLRTHLMVALGAAMFGIISVGGFNEDSGADPSRIASYVPAGIGFIGGGVILKRGDSVKGLTTAATLWLAAAVGLACGVALWFAAGFVTALALFSLVALKPVRSLLHRINPEAAVPASDD